MLGAEETSGDAQRGIWLSLCSWVRTEANLSKETQRALFFPHCISQLLSVVRLNLSPKEHNRNALVEDRKNLFAPLYSFYRDGERRTGSIRLIEHSRQRRIRVCRSF